MWETPQMVFFGEVQKIISDMTQEKSKTLYVCVYALSHILGNYLVLSIDNKM